MVAVWDHGLQETHDMLGMLEGTLVEARAHSGDPGALAPIISKLVGLVEEGLPRLSGLQMGPEEKAVMLRLQAQIAELERFLQIRAGVLAGFSLYLREFAEGRGR